MAAGRRARARRRIALHDARVELLGEILEAFARRGARRRADRPGRHGDDREAVDGDARLEQRAERQHLTPRERVPEERHAARIHVRRAAREEGERAAVSAQLRPHVDAAARVAVALAEAAVVIHEHGDPLLAARARDRQQALAPCQRETVRHDEHGRGRPVREKEQASQRDAVDIFKAHALALGAGACELGLRRIGVERGRARAHTER